MLKFQHFKDTKLGLHRRRIRMILLQLSIKFFGRPWLITLFPTTTTRSVATAATATAAATTTTPPTPCTGSTLWQTG
jgi:hypothetical protein